MFTTRYSSVIAIVIVSIGFQPAAAGWKVGWRIDPIGISINDRGEVSFSVSTAVQTPIGVFYISRDEGFNRKNGFTYVVVRNHRTQTSKVYEIYSGDDELSVDVEAGNVTVKDRVITINVTGYGYADLKYEIGKLKQQHTAELVEAKEQGFNDGKTFGHAAGRSEGYSLGEENGRRAGHYEGYNKGLNEGKLRAVYKAGQGIGYVQGNIDGFARGANVGYKRGFADGHTQGLEEGTNQGLKAGYAKGFDAGRAAGILEEQARQATIQANQDIQAARYRGMLTTARKFAHVNDPVLTQDQPSWGDIQRSLSRTFR